MKQMIDLALLTQAIPYLEILASFIFGAYAGKCHAKMSFNIDLNGEKRNEREECCLVPVVRELVMAIRARGESVYGTPRAWSEGAGSSSRTTDGSE